MGPEEVAAIRAAIAKEAASPPSAATGPEGTPVHDSAFDCFHELRKERINSAEVVFGSTVALLGAMQLSAAAW